MHFLTTITIMLEHRLWALTRSDAVRAAFRAFLYRLSPALLVHHRYRMKFGRLPNLKEPETYNDNLIWLNLYWRHPLKTQCGDKYEMRSTSIP